MIFTVFIIICLVWVIWWWIDIMKIFANILLTNKEERKKFKEFLIAVMGIGLMCWFMVWAVGIKI